MSDQASKKQFQFYPADANKPGTAKAKKAARAAAHATLKPGEALASGPFNDATPQLRTTPR